MRRLMEQARRDLEAAQRNRNNTAAGNSSGGVSVPKSTGNAAMDRFMQDLERAEQYNSTQNGRQTNAQEQTARTKLDQVLDPEREANVRANTRLYKTTNKSDTKETALETGTGYGTQKKTGTKNRAEAEEKSALRRRQAVIKNADRAEANRMLAEDTAADMQRGDELRQRISYLDRQLDFWENRTRVLGGVGMTREQAAEMEQERKDLQAAYDQWERDMYRRSQERTLAGLSKEDLSLIDRFIDLKFQYDAMPATEYGAGDEILTEIDAAEKAMKKRFGDRTDSVLEYRQRQRNAEQQAQYAELQRAMTQKNAGTAIGMNAARTIANIAAGPAAAIGTAYQILTNPNPYAPIDTNTNAFVLQNFVENVQNATSEQILGENPGFWQKAGNMAYQTAISTLDSIIAAELGKLMVSPTGLTQKEYLERAAKVSGLLLGTNAAASEMKEVAERGGTAEQALTAGFAAGVFECFFEKFSIENFNRLSAVNPDSFKTIVKNIAKSMLTNGSEELNTELANVLYDYLMLGDVSDYQARLREYMENDLNEDAAKAQLAKDLGYQILMSGVGGALQGLLMGGVGSVRGYADNRKMADLQARMIVENQRLQGQSAEEADAAIREKAEKSDNKLLKKALEQVWAEERPSFEGAEAEADAEAETAEGEMEITEGAEEFRAEQNNAAGQEAAETTEMRAEDRTAEAGLAEDENETVQRAREIIDAVLEDQNNLKEKDAMIQSQQELWEDDDPELADTLGRLWETEREALDENGIRRTEPVGTEIRKGLQQQAEALLEMGLNDQAAALETTADAGYNRSAANAQEVNYGKGTRGSSEWNDRIDTGRTAGQLAGGAGQNQTADGGRNVQAGRAAERRNQARNSGTGGQSTRQALNVRSGAENDSIYVPKQETWDEEIRTIYRDAAANGYEYTPVVGVMHFVTRNGRTIPVDGYERNGRFAARIDHDTVSATVFANHEMFHAIAGDNPGLVDTICAEILSRYTDEELDSFVDAYATAYRGANLSRDQIMEEICADIYANRSRYGLDLTGNTENVRQRTGELTDTQAIGTRGETQAETEDSGLVLPTEEKEAEPENEWDYDEREDEEDRYSIEGEESDEEKYSVNSIFDAAGLVVTREGNVIKAVDLNGNPVTEVSEDMVWKSGIGAMINRALNTAKTISQADAQEQIEAATELLNMMLQSQDGAMVWEFAGAAMFSAVRTNADGQYRTTIDFTTICRRTQNMVKAMSEDMLRLHRGLTRDEVTALQKKIIDEGATVQCPVCYVFSRWAGIGGILGNMYNFQNKYGHEYDGYVDENGTYHISEKLRERIDQLREATNSKASLRKMLREYDDEYRAYEEERDAAEQDNRQLKALRTMLNRTKPVGYQQIVESINKKIELNNTLLKQIKDDLKELESKGAPELSWLVNVRSAEDYWENGYVAEEVLFDLNEGERFASESPLAWKYRTGRGPSAGKAILPYSDWRLGDLFMGPQKGGEGRSDLFARVDDGEFSDEQEQAIEDAEIRMKAQNLIGGQRFQTTSDYRYEYGLDYLMAFWELQAVGGKMQTYTKVVEYADLVASIHGDVNVSVMPEGKGYQDGKLVCSAVTGMNFEAAKRINDMYDNVQLVLVGINDDHIALALDDSEETGGYYIGFVIPYHASGASITDFISKLVENLGEHYEMDAYRNYEPLQRDSQKKISGASKDTVNAWMAAMRENPTNPQFTGRKPTAAQRAALEKRLKEEIRGVILRHKIGNSKSKAEEFMAKALPLIRGVSRDISNRTFEDLRNVEIRAMQGDRAAIREYESWSNGILWDLYNKMWVDESMEDTYGVMLDSQQAQAIMPHEYWNKQVRRDKAYVNNFIFRSYCYNLGLTPRFTGLNSSGRDIGYGDFSKYKGYWKTLIDRPMYTRYRYIDGQLEGGYYRDQEKINVTNLSGGMLTEEWARDRWGEWVVPGYEEEKAVTAARKLADEIEAREQNQQRRLPAGEERYSVSDEDEERPITMQDVETLRSIGKKRISQFTSEDIKKAEPWARKFYRELGTKSPFFRAWFGDWRAADTTKISLPVLDMNAASNSGNAINEDTGKRMSWNRDFKRESLLYANQNTYREISTFGSNAAEIVKNAVLLDTVVSKKDSKRKMPGTSFMHSFYTLVPYEGRMVLVKMYAEEALSEKTGEDFTRAYMLKTIEEVADIDNSVLSKGGLTGSLSATSDYTVADLYALVKRYDRDFHGSEPSAVINRDGTPRVVYHRTNADFTAFDTSLSGSNQGKTHGDGVYLSTSRDAFNYAGDKVLDLYASIRNPFEMEMTEEEANRVYDKYAAPHHNDRFGLYRPHAIAALMSSYKVFDYLDEYAQESGVKVSNILKHLGYDGVHDGPEWVAFDPEQVKSATDNIGTFDRENDDIQYSVDDEEYMVLAEDPEANEEQLQEMVDAAAEAAMPESRIRDEDGNLLRVYHGTSEQFTVFDRTKGRSTMDIQGSFFSPWEIDASGYGENVRAFYLNIRNPAPEGVAYRALNRFKGQNNAGIRAREYLESLGYDGVNNGNEEYIAFNSEQIKSADPVTYDDEGNVIPLSERFNDRQNDIRYSVDDEEYEDRYSIATEKATLEGRLETLNQRIAELDEERELMDEGEFRRQWYDAANERAAVRSQLQELRDSVRRAKEREQHKRFAQKNDRRDMHRENARQYREEAKTAEKRYEETGHAADKALAENYRNMAKKEQGEVNRIGREIRKDAGKSKVRAKPTSSLRDTTTRILNLFNIQAGYRSEAKAVLNDILTRSLERGNVGEQEIRDIIERLYETGVEVVPPTDPMYEDVAKYIRGKTVYASPELQAEFGDEWKNFRSRLFGLGLYTSKDIQQLGVDSMYQELSEMYPGVFDESETDMRTMLENVVDVARRGKSEHISLEENARRMGISREEDFEAAYDMVRNALNVFAEKAALETDLKEWTSRKIREANEENREQIRKVREHRDQKVNEAYQHFRNVMDRQAERRAKAEADLKLRRAVERLRRRAKVNDQTLTRVIAEQSPAVQEAAKRALEQLDTMANRLTGKKRLELTELKNIVLERQANDPNFELKPGTAAALQRLGQIRLNELSVEDVEAMRDAVNRITHDLETADQMISDAWDQQVAEVGEQVKREVDFSKGDRREGRARELFNEESLSPSRALLRYVGYDRNGAMGQLVAGLEKGNLDEMEYQLRAGMIFEDFLKDKKNQEWLKTAAGKEADTVKLQVPTAWLAGKGDVPLFEDLKKGAKTTEIELTQMMIASMARDLNNEQNMWHALYGGYTLPDMDLYRKGKYQDAYTQKGKQTVKMPKEFVQSIVSKYLKPEGREYVKLLDEYYDKYSKENINRISRMVDGVDRAMTQHYSPIRTDANFRGKSYNVFDGTLQGMGSLKNRKYYSGTPIILEDADKTMRWHVDNMARYVGYAVPIRDIKAVLAYKPGFDTETVEGKIGEKYGTASQRFIEDLIQLIETGQLNGKGEDVFSKLTGGYVRRVLMWNISSAMKQLAALPLAGSTLGQGAMANALLHKPADPALIRKYSPYLAFRGEGFTYAELADYVRNLDGKRKSEAMQYLLGENWLDKVDQFANRYLWNAAEYVVRNQYGLQPGSQAEIDAGTDPFYKKVAELFNRATFDTQTNANTMSKPLILARHNPGLQLFTMFKTDALQLQGIARESYGAWKTAQKHVQQNDTPENRDKLTLAKRNLKKAVWGILLSSFVQSMLGMAAKWLRGDDKTYRDDEGDLTLESVGKAVAMDTLQNMVGSVIFGDQLMEMLNSFVFDEKLWEPEIPSVSAVYDTYKSLSDLFHDIGDTVAESIRIARDRDTDLTFGSYMDMQSDKLLGDLRDVGYELSTFFGRPVQNFEKTVTGMLGHAFPELKVGWNDIFKEYAKSDLKTMSGDALTASVEAYLTDVIGETSEREVEELQRLYEQFENDALPGKNPPQDATPHEAAQWEYAYRENMREALSSVMDSREYWGQADEQRVYILKKANEYAGGISSMDILGTEPEKWIRNTEKAYRLGVELGDTFSVLAFKASLAGTGDGQKDQVLEYIDDLNYTAAQKDALYFCCNYGESKLDEAPWH